MNYIEFDTVHVMELAIERDILHAQQPSHHFDRFAHRFQGLLTLDTNVTC